jgi:hypothetical protein
MLIKIATGSKVARIASVMTKYARGILQELEK